MLEGQRKGNTNKIKGGHSPKINNANPDFATEVIKINPDGTKVIKFIKQFPDGKISKIKTSTLFPNGWSDAKIIDSIQKVANGKVIGVRASDGAELLRGTVDGVEIEVIKIGNEVVSGIEYLFKR
ncbi:EndoU domain-containing protein [Lactiplantibacillus plantarum]|uniref:EndoU domain-containing protein n=1 Tax=Lactiplantibacillus plantarum TaxID=1590 RepID=UPI00288A050E|nr:EndoU domain-containing protein [Lactiplantibacillus plantarum]MCT4451088.1 hypothetical protein [Lactiplantibacillus plantarum]MCT4459671.1 hypothetical protein [Lactiplantibacillus plantarum]